MSDSLSGLNLKSGFSLLELLMVLSIMSLVATFVYPSYSRYIYRAHRIEGQMALYQLAAKMEEYYAKNHTYLNATLGDLSHSQTIMESMTPGKRYRLSIIEASDDSYTLQAMPLSGQAGDRECQAFRLNHVGVKSIIASSGGSPTGKIEACWTN